MPDLFCLWKLNRDVAFSAVPALIIPNTANCAVSWPVSAVRLQATHLDHFFELKFKFEATWISCEKASCRLLTVFWQNNQCSLVVHNNLQDKGKWSPMLLTACKKQHLSNLELAPAAWEGFHTIGTRQCDDRSISLSPLACYKVPIWGFCLLILWFILRPILFEK